MARKIQQLESSPQVNDFDYQNYLKTKKQRLKNLEEQLAGNQPLSQQINNKQEPSPNKSYWRIILVGSLVGLGLIGLVVYLLLRKKGVKE